MIEISLPKAFRELWEPKRYKVYYGGRGAAKSQSYATTLLLMAYRRPMRVLCARELQVSIADSVHRLLADQIDILGLGSFYEVQKGTIFGANGSEFIFKGLKHNVSEIKSLAGVDVCWVEEAEKVSSSSWEVLIPTIRKEGSEIWISFNPKHPTDATYKRFVMNPPDAAVVRKVSWRDNKFFPSVLEAERLDMLKRDPDAYQHIWEGEFDTRYSGAVYAKWVAKLQEGGRVTNKVLHDPAFPVYTAWDLGYGDATAIWFYQMGANEIVVIDYYENNVEDIQHYCEVLYGRELIVEERELHTGIVVRYGFGADLEEGAHRKEYRYAAHYVPQDAGKKVLEAAGRSVVEQARKDWGIKMSVMPETTHVNRHQAARKTLPRCWFNTERCADGLDALMNYHYKYDEDRQDFGKEPYHDWSSHGSTAFELLSRVWTERRISTKDMDNKEIRNTFFRKRSENGLDNVDPYRVKPRRK